MPDADPPSRPGSLEQIYPVAEVVSVGHGMGAALCYLLGLDLVDQNSVYVELPPNLRFTVAAFGSPRVGNAALYDQWQRLKEGYSAAHAPDSLREFSVRAANDGIAAVPPYSSGYRHLARVPLYLYHTRLFYIRPTKESTGSSTYPRMP